jgi:hypothetical protein
MDVMYPKNAGAVFRVCMDWSKIVKNISWNILVISQF